MDYQLFTDTDTDITPEVAQTYGYKLISMPYAEKLEEQIFPYEDFEVFDYKAFYDKLRGGVLPKTFALSPAKYMEYFEPTLKEGKDILYVHFSKAMSGTFNAMDIALKELKEKYPERTIYTIDTKAITILSYIIVREIGDMALNGASIQEILKWAETEVDKFAVYFYAEDLKFFGRSGRVSGFAAGMGNLLGIKPIINIGSDGKMKSIAKAKGKKGANEKLMQYVEDLQDNLKDHRVIVGHTDSLALAKEIEAKLKEKYGQDLNTEIVVVNPTAGSHCGPNTIGIAFHSIHR
ncbi:MAG: DegV family protein [Clostridia bacterium]|nr:DegV family protein [Clostridia bacterium]